MGLIYTRGRDTGDEYTRGRDTGEMDTGGGEFHTGGGMYMGRDTHREGIHTGEKHRLEEGDTWESDTMIG